MESNQTGVIKIGGSTPEELAKDFMTAVKIGNMNMEFGVQVLIERVYVAATHEIVCAIKESNQRALVVQVEKARQARDIARKAQMN